MNTISNQPLDPVAKLEEMLKHEAVEQDMEEQLRSVQNLPEALANLCLGRALGGYHSPTLVQRCFELGARAPSSDGISRFCQSIGCDPLCATKMQDCLEVMHKQGWDFNQIIDGSSLLHNLIDNIRDSVGHQWVEQYIAKAEKYGLNLTLKDDYNRSPVKIALANENALGILYVLEKKGVSVDPNEILEVGIQMLNVKISVMGLALGASPLEKRSSFFHHIDMGVIDTFSMLERLGTFAKKMDMSDEWCQIKAALTAHVEANELSVGLNTPAKKNKAIGL